ncbi:alpha/beta hydrolase [Bradyrhizobium sp. SZCCHNS3002]|uniref:alpha/beta fold hydrolase n=1 Tax=Bradyrhizobium sp. SZCCHNS3002 TaxID=3057310 RepID=UPI0028EC6155|nr:alpha/beta hydrolase [Bradyrhizobium sp. SZCCHNS3002]
MAIVTPPPPADRAVTVGSAHITESPLAASQIRSRRIQANGLDFPILEAGNGPLVLCLHGFPDHARSWCPLLVRLARAGYWAVAPALRGYWVGGAAPDGSYRAAATGQDVLALIESLGAQQAVLVGHDLGARAAYAAASLDGSRIAKLVGLAVPYGKGLATAFFADGDQQRRSWYMFFFQTRLAETAIELNDFAFLHRLWREWSPGYELASSDRSALNETFRQPGVLAQALAYYRQLFTPPSDPAMQALETLASRSISIPSLYLHGADDGCISAHLSEGMDAMFTNGLERVIMPGVGHFLHLEQTDAVLNHILRFLRM